MDVCLSNYRQLFGVNFSYYNYHYDLQDTARYYCLFDDLMAHWKTIFGERFHEVQYEELVEDPEPVVRELCHYVGRVLPEQGFIPGHHAQCPGSPGLCMITMLW